MTPEQTAIAVLTFIGGAGVLGSYVPLVMDQRAGKYDFWLGIRPDVRHMFYAFWVLAAAGFLFYTMNAAFGEPPVNGAGLFSYAPGIRAGLIGVVLAASILWSVFVVAYARSEPRSTVYKILTVACLLVVAVAALLLLAGEAERGASWYVILGLMLFALVPVLVDGVMWNARFILHG